MIGSFAVGKTSLVQQFVNSIFSEKYLTTIGVKIDQKIVNIGQEQVNLVIWDIHGEDEYQKIKSSYLMGSSGYFIVIDGTRKSTLKIANSLIKLAQATTGDVPFIMLINKSDVKKEWELSENDIIELTEKGWHVIETSAKTGENVEHAFLNLTKLMLYA
ncbi:MAG: GTP-binding protein [Bacteroidales bacterium]|nr:GTP-binding protein [Bacteroidales bacterium]